MLLRNDPVSCDLHGETHIDRANVLRHRSGRIGHRPLDLSRVRHGAGTRLAVAATLPTMDHDRHSAFMTLVNLEGKLIVAGRICVGLFLPLTGIQHFLYTEFVASLIPGWFPGDPVFWTYFGGVALIAGGTGLLIPRTARLAALLSGAMVFSWFWIIYIPRTLTSVSDAIAVFEALATAGILFVIAGFLYQQRVNPVPRGRSMSERIPSSVLTG